MGDYLGHVQVEKVAIFQLEGAHWGHHLWLLKPRELGEV